MRSLAARAGGATIESVPPALRHDSGVALRSRLASLGVIVILLGVSIFAVWSSNATFAASGRAESAVVLSADYTRAATAVGSEESLERKYRLDPSPAVRANFSAVAADLVAALTRVRADGGAADKTLVDRVEALHTKYLTGTTQLFAAVDSGDTAAVLLIDAETEPSFAAIEASVLGQAAKHQSVALLRLAQLERLQTVTSRLTPAVFGLGLILAALLALTGRAYRRVLVGERRRAVHDSLHDALTGLPNRTLLIDRVDQALISAVRTHTGNGLLLLDLDRFKDVNDTFGHRYGDELLTQIGPRLSEALRASDTVARLGGDEFAILLPDIADIGAVKAVAEKLQHALEAPFHVAGVDLDVEASIGVVIAGEHGDDAATLLQHADTAMYVAKAHHLGVAVYCPELDAHSPAKLTLVGELRRALIRDELVLHYQPQVSLSTGDVIGAEALIRWQNPTRGLIYPDNFMPIAEHTGLIGPLTRWVLNEALAQARVWLDAGRAMPVSVNLSARNLLDEQLPEQVAALLTAHGVPAALLELEVTESAIITNPDRARDLLQRIAKLGVRVSIDDFGAGYTSLGQLKTLPISELKIDRSFVMTITEDASDAHIVRSMIDLGHNLGLTIVAEGVETEQASAALASLGCDVAQGYYICRPLPIDTFDLWCLDQPIAGIPHASQISSAAPFKQSNMHSPD